MMTEEGNLMIADHGLLNDYKDNYRKGAAGQKDVYLTPRQLEQLKAGNKAPSYDVQKTDVFSLGLSLIYASTLEDPKNCYDWSKKTLNNNAIEAQLAKIEQSYSPSYSQLVRAMVDPNDLSRPDFHQLQALVNANSKPVGQQFPLQQSVYNQQLHNSQLGRSVAPQANNGFQNNFQNNLGQSGFRQY